jgi:hypothetical protein
LARRHRWAHTPDKTLDHEACGEEQPGVLAAVDWGQTGHFHFVFVSVLGMVFWAGGARRIIEALELNGCRGPDC